MTTDRLKMSASPPEKKKRQKRTEDTVQWERSLSHLAACSAEVI